MCSSDLASAQRRAEDTGEDSNEKFEGTDANGSPHANGNTAVALREMEEIFKASGVEVETVLIGNQAVRGCTACGACGKLGKCVFDDVVNELKPKFEEADGLVVASPVYYASANATLIACLNRLF